MLFVKTRTGQSTVHGTGLFATQFIPKGSLIWRYAAGHDQLLTREEFETLPDDERRDWERFAYVSRFTGLLVRSGDDYVFMNHSHDPNVGVSPVFESPEGCDVALRDIMPGDELLFDYRWFGEDPCCHPEESRLPAFEDFAYADRVASAAGR